MNIYSRIVSLLSLMLSLLPGAGGQARLQLTLPSQEIIDFPARRATFGPVWADTIEGPLAFFNPVDGCMLPADAYEGRIVLIDRGLCPFTNKVYNAQQRGAIAVVVCNNTDSRPFQAEVMGPTIFDPLAPLIEIPSIMVSFSACQTLRLQSAGTTVLLNPEPVPLQPGEVCTLAIPVTRGTYSVAPVISGFGANTSFSGLEGSCHAKWYRYESAYERQVTVTACDQPVDTRLLIFTGADCTALEWLDFNDDCDLENGVFASSLSFSALPGQVYYFYWDDYWSYEGFSFTVIEDSPLAVRATFQVDMSATTPDPAGVFIIDELGLSAPIPMSDPDGDTIYTASLDIRPDTQINYLFANGLLPETVVSVGADSCTLSPAGYRTLLVPDTSLLLPPVCFGYCVPCDELVGLEPVVSTLSLKAFPNPVKEQLFVQLPPSLAAASGRCLLTDLLGRPLREWSFAPPDGEPLLLTFEQVPPGVYLLLISGPAGGGQLRIVVR